MVTIVHDKGDILTSSNVYGRHQLSSMFPSIYIELLQEFLAKLVLEVLGAGGAVWGSSELFGLRTKEAESIRFWRSVAISVALIFAVRWFRQLQLAVLSLLQNDQNVGRTKLSIEKRASNRQYDKTEEKTSIRTNLSLENGTSNSQLYEKKEEKSPIGIQLSSFFFGGEKEISSRLFQDGEEEASLLQAEFDNESTGLATSPRSPKA